MLLKQKKGKENLINLTVTYPPNKQIRMIPGAPLLSLYYIHLHFLLVSGMLTSQLLCL